MEYQKSIYLFDKYCTGRVSNDISDETPTLAWKYEFPREGDKVFGSESTPAIDSYGNLYFGCHDGYFYSLSEAGKLRWRFQTSSKIYSSPILYHSKVYFCGGDGYLYCLTYDGLLNGKVKISSLNFQIRNFNRILDLFTYRDTYDRNRDKHIRFKSWCSPNITGSGHILVTGFGKGLYCYDQDLNLIWSRFIGYRLYKYSGVALDDSDNIYVATSSGKIRSYSISGYLRWQLTLTTAQYKAWGNPSVDLENNCALFSFSLGEESAVIGCVSLDGQLRWKFSIPSGLRGGIAIGHGNHYYFCSLAGDIYYVCKITGRIDNQLSITTAPRGLWTTPAITPSNKILITCKDSDTEGRLLCLDSVGKTVWQVNTGKAYSTPVISIDKKIYVGSWKGFLGCYANS
jgi:outer membrane protein assembly factor BamB